MVVALLSVAVAVGGGAGAWDGILTGSGTLGCGGGRPVAAGADGGGSESGDEESNAF